MSCSVVMVSYFSGPVLFAAVKTVLKQENLAELVLVSNGNPPDVAARLAQMALTDPRLVVVSGHGNIGFAKACNIGAKQATGDFILFVGPDCLLPSVALSTMMQEMENFPGAMLASGWLQTTDGSEQKGARRQLLTPKTAIVEALRLYHLFKIKRLNETDSPLPRNTHEVPAVSSTFMCIRKADFEKLFGFDEGFFLHVEDMDMCMRVHKEGGKVICVPAVEVTHMRGLSDEAASRMVEWHRAKGLMRYFHKHFRGAIFPGDLLLINAAIVARFAAKFSLSYIRDGLAGKKRLRHSVASKRLMTLASGLYELSETKEFEGVTVLVTNATGQVGLSVVRRLLAAGASVLALGSQVYVPFRHERLRWLHGDVSEASTLGGYCVDSVVHASQLWELPPALAMLHTSETKRVVAVGSTSIFAKAMSKNWHEKELVDKLTHAEADIASLCADHKMEWTILRPTMIYGIGLDLGITSLTKWIARVPFFPIYPPAFGKRHPVHVDDLAAAVVQVLQNKTTYGKSYNISGGEALTFREMIERLFALCQKPVRIVPTTLLPFILDVAGKLSGKKHINGEIAHRMNDDLVFFHDEAKKDFGFSPRAFLSGGMKDVEGF